MKSRSKGLRANVDLPSWADDIVDFGNIPVHLFPYNRFPCLVIMCVPNDLSVLCVGGYILHPDER